jgi:hypothetical protein
MDTMIDMPKPPAHLPAEAVQLWRNSFASAYKSERDDYPAKPQRWRKAAIKAAAKAIAISQLESFEDAMKLQPWQFIYREQVTTDHGQVLKVVTSEGKKYYFPVPAE